MGHSLRDDFEYLKLNENEYGCEIRDISHFSNFLRHNQWENSPIFEEESKGHVSPNNSASSSDSSVSSLSDVRLNSQFVNRLIQSRSSPFGAKKRKLKDLASEFLNASIQTGHHSSIIDARVSLALYRTFQLSIEHEAGTGRSVGFRISHQ